MSTKIEWTDETWNPVRGCSRVSEGCRNCYAEKVAVRFSGEGMPYHGFATAIAPRDSLDRIGGRRSGWTRRVELIESKLDEPLRWRKPRRIFVNSMSDLFHEKLGFEDIAHVFQIMAHPECDRHTFQILTKRPERMVEFFRWAEAQPRVAPWPDGDWILGNVWLGVSVENQATADERIPLLMQTPAAVRFLSCEPLLGPLNLDRWAWTTVRGDRRDALMRRASARGPVTVEKVDWVIAGGESGPGARPMHPDWARSLRDQCAAAGVPFFFKQWGEYLPVKVEDDKSFAGGRAFDHPAGGGRSSISVRTPSRKPFQSGTWKSMEPGDRAGFGTMLDCDTIAVHVGKKRAGRELDGRTWDEFPAGVA